MGTKHTNIGVNARRIYIYMWYIRGKKVSRKKKHTHMLRIEYDGPCYESSWQKTFSASRSSSGKRSILSLHEWHRTRAAIGWYHHQSFVVHPQILRSMSVTGSLQTQIRVKLNKKNSSFNNYLRQTRSPQVLCKTECVRSFGLFGNISSGCYPPSKMS